MIKKSHILKLDVSGRFAINVVDNLIIVHHQASKVSKQKRFKTVKLQVLITRYFK